MLEALDIQVTGIVQGVGFRPFVYRLAKKYQITGWVKNAVDGVHVRAEGESQLLDEFVLEISDNAPAAAQVKQIDLKEVPLEHFEDFEILLSDDGDTDEVTLISPDLGICDECAKELLDPANRRFRYPFINCTNCGPRFTIVDSLPYDRPRTSMASFAMCPACSQEYSDPADRRFHAQPDACWECGPRLSLSRGSDGRIAWASDRASSDELLAQTVSLLKEGGVVAVKGLGGFHLCCDAESEQAVARLRAGKKRKGKPFAVMAVDVEAARQFCHVGPEEEKVLTSAARPIVLLRKTQGCAVAAGVADGLAELGVMLPSTPLQILLMNDFIKAGGRLLVMTSGNLHDEPIVVEDAEARDVFANVADAVLGNDRPILSRYDDSVVRVLDFGPAGTAVQMIRRARGFAPAPLQLGAEVLPLDQADSPSTILAVGPEQKNTLCVLKGAEAFVSQHIGDLENAQAFDAWVQAKDRLQTLFDAEAQLVAYDLHPEYLSSKWAEQAGLPRAQVQHHHAHIVSAMAEAGIAGPVCGIAFDGTGAGVDGAIWGGEVLLSNCSDFERFANFAYLPMPGGAAAIANPLRMAYGALWACDLLDHPQAAGLIERLDGVDAVLEGMVEQGINTPYTSSVGRLFDAVSALLGICEHPTYEGEPAIMLEAAAWRSADDGSSAVDRYAVNIVKNTATENSTAQDTSVLLMDAEGTLRAVLDDMEEGVAVEVIAARFHKAMAVCIAQVAQLVQAFYGINQVVLSGGVFMNRMLIQQAVSLLADCGLTVVLNRDLPPNDGSISLGQAVIAWHAENDA